MLNKDLFFEMSFFGIKTYFCDSKIVIGMNQAMVMGSPAVVTPHQDWFEIFVGIFFIMIH